MYTPPSHDEIIKNLKRTIEVAARAKALGRHPFGSIVVGPEGNVIAEQGNIDTVNHAESTLARTVCKLYPYHHTRKGLAAINDSM